MTDQQIDEFLEMLAKSPTSARDMVRGLFAANEAKAAPASTQDEPFGYFRVDALGWTDCAATDEGAIALYERPAAPAVPQGEPEAYMVYGNYTRQPFRSIESAQAYMGGLLKSDPEGGYHIRPLFYATPAAPSQPAVPQGIPAHEVIDAIEAWKSAWAKVPPFGNKVNKATREAITFSHNTLFQLLWSAQQAQRMPKACPTPTGCGPHGCHGACITVTTPAPSQPVTLTDEEIKRNWSGGACPPWGIKFARAIIAALREKGKA